MRQLDALLVAGLVMALGACEAREEAEGAELSGTGEMAAEVTSISEETPGLMARAKVQGETARATALALVPSGRVTGAELEEEDGLLIYSFDVSVQGVSGVEEIHVDALTGKVVSQVHEDEAAEDEDEAAEGPEGDEGDEEHEVARPAAPGQY